MKCKYFEKETGNKYCSNYLGPQIVWAYGEGTIIKHNCKDKCKYVDCKKLEELQGLKRGWLIDIK